MVCVYNSGSISDFGSSFFGAYLAGSMLCLCGYVGGFMHFSMERYCVKLWNSVV